MPMSKGFSRRLLPQLPEIARHYGTPFFVYDAQGIRETVHELIETFASCGFRHPDQFQEFFAVKALSNPVILTLLHDLGLGFDCSSPAELKFVRQIGAKPDQILFTSNNTQSFEMAEALDHGGAIINFDDIKHLRLVNGKLPSLVCFRYNPGPKRTTGYNAIIGAPAKCKYGVPDEQIVEAYRQAIERGATEFGLHTMIVSNERDYRSMTATAALLLNVATRLQRELGIKLKFINLGGGIGIPYRPKDEPFNLPSFATEIRNLFDEAAHQLGYQPKLYLECGRHITGPHGVFIAQVVNIKESYETFIGLDANCTSSIMRPVMYYPDGGYHHISIAASEGREQVIANVVGSVCEDRERFAWNRPLPKAQIGDLVVMHDCGAHAPQMGGRYNNRPLECQELLLDNGTIRRIRRAETFADLTATLHCDPDRIELNPRREIPCPTPTP
ncbi:MAG: hypothetical protein A3J59_03825 [Candidatus Buchananbacteria bacterium RIFCSPHIGHO2_02_FULL_56_16]|uniref:Diaminopimelate decarboxylase n=1 Tax=Candidatus Buchananbacteria bacterium RIFCSPHIGHO2_02_FULL_56_16 TaxID=1797542 RepID=A0A1G1YIB6_9BACT|nr:MAG: hypothetical protein A3J59_03825 [Candidatus Buchananbacteria bacterium RIFCSPHIGHO2_02_FULL_56_16]